jgi:cysteine-rich repeat protein
VGVDFAAVCKCNSGYQGDGKSCSDIDECAASNGGCGDAKFFSCKNNVGSAATCSDIDECAANNGGCGDAKFFSCKNNIGSAATCSDIDECAANNGGCGAAPVYLCENQSGALPNCSGPHGPKLAAGDLVIAELMYNPATVTDDKGEWFELYNPSTAEIDLGGVVVRSAANKFVVPAGTLIGAGGLLVFGLNKDVAVNGGAPVDVALTATQTNLLITLVNSGSDDLTMESNGVVIDAVVYDFAKGWPSVSGASLMLSGNKLNAGLNDSPLVWCVSTAPYGLGDKGTPGALNGNCPDDKDKDGVPDADDNCPALANGSQLDTDGDKVGDVCDNCPSDANSNQADANGNGKGDACDPPECGNGSVETGETCDDGNKVSGDGCSSLCAIETTVAEPGVGDLVITEIMVDPSTTEPGTEWFEILNVSNKTFDLKGLVVQGKDSTEKFTVAAALPCKPGQMIVFANSLDPTKNGGFSADVAYSNSSFPLSNSSADGVELIWAGTSIDKVMFTWGGTSLGWPSKVAGTSLNLSASKTSAAANDTPGSWCLGASVWSGGVDKGSPGALNPDCAAPAPVKAAPGLWWLPANWWPAQWPSFW